MEAPAPGEELAAFADDEIEKQSAAVVVEKENVNDVIKRREGWQGWRWGWWNYRMIRNRNPEVSGYIMTGTSRGAVISWIAVFSVLALTGLAESVQDCDTETISLGSWTIRTDSVVSVALAIEGVISTIVTPMAGALADATSQRTLLFRGALWGVITVISLAGVVMFFDGELWSLLVFGFLLVLASLSYDFIQILHASYLPEFSPHIPKQTKIAANMYGMLNFWQLIFVLVAGGLNLVLGIKDKITSAQIGVVVCVVIWAIWAIPGMYLMEPRYKPVENKIPAGCLGIPRVVRMIKLCFTKHNQLGIFLLGYSLYIAGASSLIALASSYMLTELGVSAFQLQVLVGITLFFTVPGALLMKLITRLKWVSDLRRANMLAVAFWILIIVSIPITLIGEPNPEFLGNSTNATNTACFAVDDEGNEIASRQPKGFSNMFIYVHAVAWGIGIGAIFPLNVALASSIIPGAEESAWNGMKTFAGKVFAALPPLFFAIINENTAKPRLAIIAVLPFLLLGFFFAWLLDLDKAKEEIKDTLHKRFDASAEGRAAREIQQAEL